MRRIVARRARPAPPAGHTEQTTRPEELVAWCSGSFHGNDRSSARRMFRSGESGQKHRKPPATIPVFHTASTRGRGSAYRGKSLRAGRQTPVPVGAPTNRSAVVVPGWLGTQQVAPVLAKAHFFS